MNYKCFSLHINKFLLIIWMFTTSLFGYFCWRKERHSMHQIIEFFLNYLRIKMSVNINAIKKWNLATI